MNRRKKYQRKSGIWSWISFIIFGLIVALLGYSVLKKESPAAVLKTLVKSDLADDDIRRLSKKKLIALVKEKDSLLTQLETELELSRNSDGFSKGTISTSSETLNMRSKPSLESEVLIRIPTGSQVSILYYDDQMLFLDGAMGQWCKIRYADKEGWVWGNYIKE